MNTKPIGYYTLPIGALYITYYRVALPIDGLHGEIVAGRFRWLNQDWDIAQTAEPDPQPCRKCRVVKPVTEFHRDVGRNGNGFKRICIICENEETRIRKQNRASAKNGQLGGRPQIPLDEIDCTCGKSDAPLNQHSAKCRRRSTYDQRQRRADKQRKRDYSRLR